MAKRKAKSTPKKASAKVSGNDTLMALLCYLGVLVLIPALMRPKSAFVRAHMKQGLMLFVGWVISWGLAATFVLMMLIPLWNFVLVICSIVGIVKVLQGKTWKLPLVGEIADRWDL